MIDSTKLTYEAFASCHLLLRKRKGELTELECYSSSDLLTYSILQQQNEISKLRKFD